MALLTVLYINGLILALSPAIQQGLHSGFISSQDTLTTFTSSHAPVIVCILKVSMAASHHIPHSVNQQLLHTIFLFSPLLPPFHSLPCPACDANQYIYQPPGTMSVCLPCPTNSSSATGNVEVCECLPGTGRVSEASGLLDQTESCTSEQ